MWTAAPDCKSQVAVAYDEDGRPAHIENVVISTQHTEDVDHDTIYSYCVKLIKNVLPAELLDERTEYFINPTGKFVVGGPHGDSGLTGRKIIVDTYGGMGAPRRRSLFRERPVQGGPFRRVYVPLGCQAHCGCRTGGQM